MLFGDFLYALGLSYTNYSRNEDDINAELGRKHTSLTLGLFAMWSYKNDTEPKLVH